MVSSSFAIPAVKRSSFAIPAFQHYFMLKIYKLSNFDIILLIMLSTKWLLITIVSLVVLQVLLIYMNNRSAVEYSIKPFGEFYCDPLEGNLGGMGDFSNDLKEMSASRKCGGRRVTTSTDPSSPSLMCPPGSSINIIGAFYTVYDPYIQCASSNISKNGSRFPLDILVNACNSNETEPPAACYVGTSRENGFLNQICGPENEGGCKIRDATAYISRQCNGREQCNVTVDPQFTGPAPCIGIPMHGETEDGKYRLLPLIDGRPDQISGVSRTKQQGYRFSGIYTCVAN